MSISERERVGQARIAELEVEVERLNAMVGCAILAAAEREPRLELVLQRLKKAGLTQPQIDAARAAVAQEREPG